MDPPKKERKRKHGTKRSVEDDTEVTELDTSSSSSRDKKKKSKKEKKKKRKREESNEKSSHHNDHKKEEGSSPPPDGSDDDKKHKKDKKKRSREAKSAEKAALLERVPKVDEDGIAYTKLQLRRMMRRIKRGLSPVPTEQEERERRRQELMDRKEEEAELAGMLYQRSDGEKEDENAEEVAGESTHESRSEPSSQAAAATTTQPQKKKAKRSKPVPPDYVCQACKNKNSPAHWIYDCPDKVSVRGSNQIAKKLRGLHDPDSRKVFVSGLSFDAKKRNVEAYFTKHCGKVIFVKLLTFEDTGRCKGQAFVTFNTDEEAQKALKLSGTIMEHDEDEASKKKKHKAGDSAPKRKELRLKVSKVLNRSATKKSK